MGNVLPVTAVLRSTERMTVDFQFARYRGSSLLPVPAVNILKPGDVILSDIPACLHLDQFKRDFPWIFKSMGNTGGNVGRTVLFEQ